jgi:hypothetical protein
MGSGEGSSLPQRGSRAKPALGWLKRSAAFRGRSLREEGVQGEETHNLWRTDSSEIHFDWASPPSACVGSLIPCKAMIECETPGSRATQRGRRPDHAAPSSASAGVLYPSDECSRSRL